MRAARLLGEVRARVRHRAAVERMARLQPGGAEVGSAEALVGGTARVTRSLLFVDVAQALAATAGEGEDGPTGDDALMIEWLKRNISFNEVLPVRRMVETPRVLAGATTLFACVRS